MAFIFDGVNKVITLTPGTTVVSVRDLWSRWVDWLLIDDNSKYQQAFTNVGGNDIDISAGTKIPIYLFLMNGWRIKPQESSHTLTINDGILLVNGGGDPFINTIGAYNVRINFQQPVQAISFSATGGSNYTLTKEEIREEIDNNSIKLNDIHKIHGLDIDVNMVVNNEERIVGTLKQEFIKSGKNVIVKRIS